MCYGLLLLTAEKVCNRTPLIAPTCSKYGQPFVKRECEIFFRKKWIFIFEISFEKNLISFESKMDLVRTACKCIHTFFQSSSRCYEMMNLLKSILKCSFGVMNWNHVFMISKRWIVPNIEAFIHRSLYLLPKASTFYPPLTYPTTL